MLDTTSHGGRGALLWARPAPAAPALPPAPLPAAPATALRHLRGEPGTASTERAGDKKTEGSEHGRGESRLKSSASELTAFGPDLGAGFMSQELELERN